MVHRFNERIRLVFQLRKVINAIIAAASSPGECVIGDGKIFVSQIEDIVHVRIKERGQEAL